MARPAPGCYAGSLTLCRPVRAPASGGSARRADVHSLTSEAGFDHARLLEHQRLNHFPRHVELTRKQACGLPQGRTFFLL